MMTPYTLGLLFLLLVSIIWTLCSIIVQHLYHDMAFNSPFLIVYIGTSLFSVFLPIRLGYERCGSWWGEEVVVFPWRHDGVLLEAVAISADDGRGDGGLEFEPIDGDGDSLMPSGNNNHDNNEQDDYSFDPTNAVQMQNNGFTNESTIHSSTQSTRHYQHHYEPTPNNNNTPYLYSHHDHISIALRIAPLWFLSNYFYAISLEYTTISSSTVLASMGSLFAFGFATCSKFGDERVTLGKCLGVLMCFAGGVATAYTDVHDEDGYNYNQINQHRHLILSDTATSTHLWGDLAGLLSAIGYGAYTVLLRHLCPHDEKRMSMQLFFGYVGLLNMMALLPVALWVILGSWSRQSAADPFDNDDLYNMSNTTSSESTYEEEDIHSTLTMSIFLFLILKGLLDNVLSDYLWARAVILTSATVASVSVGLTIPMAFAADIIMGNDDGHGIGQIVGAILVLVGFVFVNVDGDGKRDANGAVDSEIEFENNGSFGEEGVGDVDIVL